mgnify:CR=1 FL=1
MTIDQIIPALPEVFVACMIMALLMLGVFQKGALADQDVKSFRLISGLAIGVLGLAILLVVMLADRQLMAFNGMFVVDGFATYTKVLVLIASAAAIVLSQKFLGAKGF